MGAKGIDAANKNYPGSTVPKSRAAVKAKNLTDDPFYGTKPVYFLVNGEKTPFYKIGDVASLLHRSPTTIRAWESRGYIPNATYRTDKPTGTQIPGKSVKGCRLYTKHQVELLLRSLQQFGLVSRNRTVSERAAWIAFTKHIKENWKK